MIAVRSAMIVIALFIIIFSLLLIIIVLIRRQTYMFFLDLPKVIEFITGQRHLIFSPVLFFLPSDRGGYAVFNYQLFDHKKNRPIN